MASSGAGDAAKLFIWVIVAVVALVGWLTGAFNRDPNKWYGGMSCSRCGYSWQSRRKTAPGRCPKCSSNQITQQLG